MDFEQSFQAIDPMLTNSLGDEALLDGQPVKVLFEAPWQQPTIGQLRTDVLEPHAVGLDSEVGGAIKGTSVLRIMKELNDYLVVEVEPDSTGMTNLVLRPLT